MSLSNDVKLRKQAVPIFPDKCVACQGKPESYWPLVTNQMHPGLLLISSVFFFFGFKRTKVPICVKCKRQFVISRLLRFIAVLALPLLLVALCWGLLEPIPRIPRRFVILAIILVGAIPAVVWQIIHPPAVDVTFDHDGTEFEFKDLEYAKEFAELNRAELLEVSFEESKTIPSPQN